MLELAAPLSSGADTIQLVPGTFDHSANEPFSGSVLSQGGFSDIPMGLVVGSITTIPEAQMTAAMAVGLALLVCLHMRVRRRLREATERRVNR
jgi:hypothetical protein